MLRARQRQAGPCVCAADVCSGRPVLPDDPWDTVRIVGEHRHGGIVLLVAALFAMLGARYWKRIQGLLELPSKK